MSPIIQISNEEKKAYAEAIKTKAGEKRFLEGVIFLLQKFVFWKKNNRTADEAEKIRNKIKNL